jgi:hypothetical protein
MDFSLKRTVYYTIVIVVMVLIVSHVCMCQTIKPGSLRYLTDENGFNQIMLGADLSSVPFDKLSYLDDNNEFDQDSCMLYQYHDSNALKITPDLMIQSIGLRTYKNKIVNIYLFFYRTDGYKVLNAFLTKYGQFTGRVSDYADVYDWKTDRLTLTLKYQLNVDLGVAIFTNTSLASAINERNKSIARLRQLLITNNF